MERGMKGLIGRVQVEQQGVCTALVVRLELESAEALVERVTPIKVRQACGVASSPTLALTQPQPSTCGAIHAAERTC